MMNQEIWVQGFADGSAKQRTLLGGKGANLAEMMRLGMPVPPGFTITTVACNRYRALGKRLPDGLWDQALAELALLEKAMGKQLGNASDPLLVSVRSGAAVSMPGMMDTVLNLGLNRQSVQGLAARTGDARFAWDCLRRFIQMFSNVVLGLQMHTFALLLDAAKRRSGAQIDAEIPAEMLQWLVGEFEREVEAQSGQPFPTEPLDQLRHAVCAVFDSWDNDRAVLYRQLHGVADDLGTAVNVQAMVFGNMGDDSATGVGFSRNPNTGEDVFYAEFLPNAQGEDVVAGIRTPHNAEKLAAWGPAAYAQLLQMSKQLENHYGDMQDLEFTVERGRLFMLQCRSGKRSGQAAVQIAVDLADEGRISRDDAVLRVSCEQLQFAASSRFAGSAKPDVLSVGEPACPGVATGKVVFTADDAVAWRERGEKVVLVRPETTPDDLAGMIASVGFLTSRGGTTCHAAIVARGSGKPCVVSCRDLDIDLAAKVATFNGRAVREGDVISFDGSDGRVALGEVPAVGGEPTAAYWRLLGWADERRKLKVRTNADNPPDAAKARKLGAEGIGLCRTEHMFGQGGHHIERMAYVQRMIIADGLAERMEALADLKPMQIEDFAGIFHAMDGLPVTIRLLDPPLHEFLPTDDEIAALARTDHRRADKIARKKAQLHETNPMLGFRGVRLGLVFPEIYRMQAEAIFEAAQQASAAGVDVRPEIMIPLVATAEELRRMAAMIRQVAAESGFAGHYLVGTMIEIPRAALVAEELGQIAEFFSFGTNDLTQTTWGFSRDDAEAGFLGHYLKDGVLTDNPFVVLDRVGVGRLVEMARDGGRRARPAIKLGICGEHGGEPKSIAFCAEIGLDYVSCSPLRVPIARLAAAQAELKRQGLSAGASSV